MSFVTLDKAKSALKAPPPSRAGRSTLTLPTVNLLSPMTLERIAVVQLRRRFLAGGIAVAVLVGGGWLVQTQRLNAAEGRLADEVAATPALTAQVEALAPVSQFYAAVDQRKLTASRAMAAEVLFSDALNDLRKQTPAGMTIQTMSVTLTPDVVTAQAPPVSPLERAGINPDGTPVTTTGTGAAGTTPTTGGPAGSGTTGATGTNTAGTPVTPGAAVPAAVAAAASADAVSCARPDPFNPARIIGCVTLSGTANSRAVVGQMIDKLKVSNLYADPFVTTTTAGGGDGDQKVSFSGSVGLTPAAVSGRYADLAWLANPDVLAEAQRLIRSGQTASSKLAKQASRSAAVEKARKEAETKREAAEQAAKLKAAEAAAKDQIEQAAQTAATAAKLAEELAKANTGAAENTGDAQ